MVENGWLQIESMQGRCSAVEWQARVDLAACYRLVAIYGMSDMMANHVSAHVPGEPGAFLINAYGMMYEEITASSLIKIDHAGNILSKPDFGDLDYGINKAGYVIHGAVHAARPELACVIHTHSWASMAVSALECGDDGSARVRTRQCRASRCAVAQRHRHRLHLARCDGSIDQV